MNDMESPMDPEEKIREIARNDGRYSHEALLFVFRALDAAMRANAKRHPPSHVSGRELLDGIRIHGAKEFGYLARTVFESWAVKTTRDFGEVVFLLVDAGLMGKTDQDSIEDFEGVYDFAEVFEKGFSVDWKQIRP